MRSSKGVPGGKRGGGGKPRGPRIEWREGWAYARIDRKLRVTLGTRDPKEAAREFAPAVARALAERDAGDAPGAPAKTIKQVAHEYLTAPHGWTARTKHTNRLRVSAFVEAMAARGATLPEQITDALLEGWRKGRETKVSRATIARDEIVAKRMFAWALHRTPPLVKANPLAGLRPMKAPRRRKPPVIPSPAEVRAAVGAALDLGEKGAALTIAAALATGMRLDELRHLRPEHVHAGAVHVTPEDGAADTAWTTKGYAERPVPLSPEAAKVVREFAEWRTTAKGGKGKPVGLADTWIAEKIDAACAKAGVPRFRMHDLRRAFATENVRAGRPITTVREWLGHVDVSTTERYLGRYRDDAAQVAATSAALDVFGDAAAKVIPMSGRKRGE